MSSNKNTLILEPQDYSNRSISIYKSMGTVFEYNKDFNNHKEIHIIICRLGLFLDMEFLSKFPSLEIIGSSTTSLTHIDEKVIQDRHIRVLSLRDCFEKISNITSTSELTIGLTIDLVRRMSAYSNSVLKDGTWNRDRFKTRQISSMNIGVLGLGRVGSFVAEVFGKFGANVSFFDCNDSIESHLAKSVSKNALLETSDILILCPSWKHGNPIIMGNREFNIIKEGVLLVNTSRAEVIDHDRLVESIKLGKVSGYATDVLPIKYENDNAGSHELVKLYEDGFNIIITPHIGGRTTDAMSYTEDCIADLVLSHYNL